MTWHSATRAMTSFTGKLKGIGFLEVFKYPIYWKKFLITTGKYEQKEPKYKIVESLLLTLNKFLSYQFLLILLEGADHEQSSQNN